MKVTAIFGTDCAVTEDSYANVVWLLKKCTSFSYVERCYRLLATFTREYNAFAGRGLGRFPNQGYRDTLVHLYDYQAQFERGLALLAVADRSGYREIGMAAEFFNYILGRPSEYGDVFEEVGFRARPDPSLGIFSWAHRASEMAVPIWRTLRAEWAFEKIFVPPVGSSPQFPQPAPLLIRPQRVQTISATGEVPAAGVWQPIDVPKGCPNFLRPDMRGVPVEIPYERLDDPLLAGEAPLRPPVIYHFKPVPTRWQLLWEDTRYRGGVIPDESEYLDRSCDFPEDGIVPAPGIPR